MKRRHGKKQKIRCTCGESLTVSGGDDFSDKKHAHCEICRLEWHITWDGKKYAHPYTPKKPKLSGRVRALLKKRLSHPTKKGK